MFTVYIVCLLYVVFVFTNHDSVSSVGTSLVCVIIDYNPLDNCQTSQAIYLQTCNIIIGTYKSPDDTMAA